jgi:hypothetical protein
MKKTIKKTEKGRKMSAGPLTPEKEEATSRQGEQEEKKV